MKHKIVICLFLLLGCIDASAKNDSTSVVKNGLGLSVAPMFTIPSYVNKNNFTQNEAKARIGATAAICQNIVLSKKHNFYLYAELGYQATAYVDQIPAAFFVQPGQAQVATSYNKLFSRNNDGYFSLSIQKVLFHLGKKAGVFLGLGAQVNYCFSITETLERSEINGQSASGTIYSSTSSNIPSEVRWSAAGVARLGFMLNPVKHVSMNIAPVFYYGLSPKYVFKNNTPGFNSVGLNLQLMYSF